MRVDYYKYHPLFGELEKNLGKVVSGLEQVEADLIVLSELAFTGYYFKDRNELESSRLRQIDTVLISAHRVN